MLSQDVMSTVQDITTVDMHTSGEATRIIVQGYPTLEGNTLLEKREYARTKLDHIRQRLMREPRGHSEMYGVILVHQTELTARGEADIGVLFCHNEGYSTMCGHATIALGRYLVDYYRHLSRWDVGAKGVEVRLHAPCGLVRISIPVITDTSAETGETRTRSDPSRSVSFLSVPSYATALGQTVDIPEQLRWPALQSSGRTSVKVDVAYGGAFYALVTAKELGFPGNRKQYQLQDFDRATAAVKEAMKTWKHLYSHPSEEDLEYLYGVIVTVGGSRNPAGEVGLCFFAKQQLDRSPTGSGVCARVALAIAKGEMEIGQSRAYHSIVSEGSADAFHGRAEDRFQLGDWTGDVGRTGSAVVVRVEGKAYYTGTAIFRAEVGDPLADGFEVGL